MPTNFHTFFLFFFWLPRFLLAVAFIHTKQDKQLCALHHNSHNWDVNSELAKRRHCVRCQQFPNWQLGTGEKSQQADPQNEDYGIGLGFQKGVIYTGKPVRSGASCNESRTQNREEITHSPQKWWERQNSEVFVSTTPLFLIVSKVMGSLLQSCWCHHQIC